MRLLILNLETLKTLISLWQLNIYGWDNLRTQPCNSQLQSACSTRLSCFAYGVTALELEIFIQVFDCTSRQYGSYDGSFGHPHVGVNSQNHDLLVSAQ